MPRPRTEKNGPSTYRDQIPLDGAEFDTIEYRTTSGDDAGTSTRSMLAGATIWESTTSWAPEDDPQLDLDLDGHMFDEAMAADVGETFDFASFQALPPAKTRTKKPKSEASVRSEKNLSIFYTNTSIIYILDKATPSLEE